MLAIIPPSATVCPPELTREVKFGLFDSEFDRPHDILVALVGHRSASALHQIHRWVLSNFRHDRTNSGFFGGQWWSVFRARDLARSIGISPGNAATLLSRLVAKGILTQAPDTSSYREGVGYRGLAYRVNYQAITTLLLERAGSFLEGAWKGAKRAFKAVTAFLQGEFEVFLQGLAEPTEVEESAPLLPKPTLKSEMTTPQEFEAQFFGRSQPTATRTSAQQGRITRRQQILRDYKLEAAIGDHLVGCSQRLADGVHLHLLNVDTSYNGVFTADRLEKWIGNKCFVLAHGEYQEQVKALRMIEKCLALGEQAEKERSGEAFAAPIPTPEEQAVLDEARAKAAKAKLDYELQERVWTRSDLTDEQFGFDYVFERMSQGGRILEFSLGEVFLHYDQNQTPLTYTNPGGRTTPVIPPAKINYNHI